MPAPSCANCGSRLPKRSRFCPECGTRVGVGPNETAVEELPPEETGPVPVEPASATPRLFRVTPPAAVLALAAASLALAILLLAAGHPSRRPEVVGLATIVNRAAGQAITSGQLTAVTWDFEREDMPDWFDPGTPDRITVSMNGLYVVTFNGVWSGGGAASSFIAAGILFHHMERIRGDGIQEVLGASQALDSHDAASTSISWAGRLQAGDAIRIKVFQATGSGMSFGGKNRVSGNPIADSSNAELGVVKVA
jgi:hypothetical protein